MKHTVLIAALLLSCTAHAAWETPGAPTVVLAEAAASAPGITATVSDRSFYNIMAADINAAVAEQLEAQGVEKKAEVNLNAGSPVNFYSSDKPVKVSIHTLQIDPTSKRWQAQANFVVNGKTESVRPISGIRKFPHSSYFICRTSFLEECI